MGFAFWYTAVLLVLMTALLIMELFEADIIVFSALLLLMLGGVVNVEEAFRGFSNQGMLTIAFLFIVAGAIQKTGALNHAGEFLLGKGGNLSRRLIRFLFPVAGISGFFNNTPIVAILIPVVMKWCRKYDISVSKVLIPLSYATILGGTCTLIGTSTNLVVHGLMLENGLKGFSLFEFSPIGVPIVILGVLWISLWGHKLLPDRIEPLHQVEEKPREFVVEMKVEKNYQHLGKTIEQAGLRHLKGLFLFQIERHNQVIAPANPDEKIMLFDRLFFTGLPETIMELQRIQGLSLLKDATFNLKNYDSDDFGVFEVVISRNSPLIGKSVRDSDFRSVYDAVIVAIHRSGERIRRKIGDIVMRTGDTMLIVARRSFIERWYHSRDFYLVSRSVEVPSKPRFYYFFSFTVLIAMIAVAAGRLAPIVTAASVAALILIISRCITTRDARNSIEWHVLLIIASSFGISKAIGNSGLSQFLAYQLIHTFGSLGILGLLAGVYFVTGFYTAIITNTAAAALVFPITLAMTQQAGIDPRPFMIAITFAASASFATPISYQTNLMVYGPGGYKFRDFLKIGIPMSIFIGIVTIALIYIIYFVL
ncbi:MAG: SLC13 family permease [Candidatus Aminicenantes bacterium]|nr:SLC13 family permease [Candidatus Aminicenantes bacterium]